MPVYQYLDIETNRVVEMVKPVAERDKVGTRYVRLTVPERVAIAGTSSSPIDPSSADATVPKAFRDLERTMPARQIARESGFSVGRIRKIWNM